MTKQGCAKKTVEYTKSVWITEHDRKRLKNLINDIKNLHANGDLQKLEIQLEHARIVSPQEIPENIVTMNCLVKLRDHDTQEQSEFWLRFAGKPEGSTRIVPILSNLGVALLGSREGDTIKWSGPEGTKRGTIAEIVYQPERLGNYDL
jgi:regulator of nucleoside diphosphate kinase